MESRLHEPTPYTMQPTTPPDDPMPPTSPGEQELQQQLPGEREARDIHIRHVHPTPKRARHAPRTHHAAGGLARPILERFFRVIRSEQYTERYPQDAESATISDIRPRLAHKMETFALCIRGLLTGAISRARLIEDIPIEAEADYRVEQYEISNFPGGPQYAPLMPPDTSVLEGGDFPEPPLRSGAEISQQVPALIHPMFWGPQRFRLPNALIPPYKRYKDDTPFQRIDQALFQAFQSDRNVDRRLTSREIVPCDEVPFIPYFRRPDKQSTPHVQQLWSHYNIIQEELTGDQICTG